MTIINAVVAGVVSIAVVASVAVLTWHGSITGEAAIGIFGTVIGGGGVAVIAHTATNTGAKAATLGKPNS